MKLWGGRFAGGTHPLMEAFGRSLESDRVLAPYDIKVCLAHLTMLTEVGVVSAGDSAKLRAALDEMAGELEEGLVPEGSHEDIHSWVEAELARRVGSLASTIRIGRSRNDLVVTDFRLWTMNQARVQQRALTGLQDELLTQALAAGEAYLPGYTHLQRAQPVLLSHHLMAHFWSFQRDFRRFDRVYDEADCCALGAGALAGSSWPIKPERSAELLGFSRHFRNSLDAVSDRDFVVEFLSACSLAAIHLSRLAEEIIFWSSAECGFAELSDAWSTGSSLMPQKKNPDPAELVRGRSGTVVGHLMALLTTLKGLPLAYNRDLQEDKPPAFAAAATLKACLQVTAGAVASLTFKAEKMAAAASDEGLLATDLADALVRSGSPFSQAHELAGKWVAGRLSEAEQDMVAPCVEELSATSVLKARSHPGAAGPDAVQAQLAEAKALLEGRDS